MGRASRAQILPTARPAAAAALVDVDVEVQDDADEIVNPRPALAAFATLAQRKEAHDRLCREGRQANAVGHIALALNRFEEAYPLLFKSSTLISLVNMHLKLGASELALACYQKILDSESLPAAERRHATAKLAEAATLAETVALVVDAPQERGSAEPRSCGASTTSATVSASVAASASLAVAWRRSAAGRLSESRIFW